MNIRKRIKLLLIPAFAVVLLLSACGTQKKEKSGITVSIEPLKYFVETLTAGEVPVNVMVPVGASPATYSPSASQLTALSSSRLYIQAGHLGFENAWMDRLKALNPEMKVLNLSKGLELIKGEDHVHGDHVHEGGVDPHIWMSPQVVLEFLPHLREMLIELFPEQKQTILQNYADLYGRTEALHKQFQDLENHLNRKAFMIFHPALTYLARDYGLEQIPIEYEGKEPTPQKLKNLIDQANSEEINVIFIQVEFDRRSAELVIGETGARLVTINPLAYDWEKELIRIHQLLKDHLD